MSNYVTHNAQPDRWTRPRQHLDPSMRRKVHGPLRPMDEPGWLARLLGRV